MPRTRATRDPAADASLRRLGGGRWQTRDERFTIEPDSGTWVVVDAAQVDELGLPLVRGPFRSLTDARAAIEAARVSGQVTSPLGERITRRRSASEGSPTDLTPTNHAAPSAEPKGGTPPRPAAEAAEPSWLADLAAPDRGRARRLIEHLVREDVGDAESIVRRDLAGDVPALAALAIRRRLDALDSDASPSEVAALLADGRDDDLGVRWRLVDGAGRAVVLTGAGPRGTPRARASRPG